MTSHAGGGFGKGRDHARWVRPRTRRQSCRVALRTEALEDRLLPSLSATLLADVNPGGANSNPSGFTLANGLICFSAKDEHGRELLASDGTATGAYLVK